MPRDNAPKPKGTATPEQINAIMAVVDANRVDAWDMGYQTCLSPGDKRLAAELMIDWHGFQKAYFIASKLKKKGG